jgi:hypothetical protein
VSRVITQLKPASNIYKMEGKQRYYKIVDTHDDAHHMESCGACCFYGRDCGDIRMHGMSHTKGKDWVRMSTKLMCHDGYRVRFENVDPLHGALLEVQGAANG